MKILIPDSSPKKIRSLRVALVRYALTKYKFKHEIADFVGVSKRGLLCWFKWYPEIREPEPEPSQGLLIEFDEYEHNKLHKGLIELVKYAYHVKVNRKHAAAFLGVASRSVYNWIHKYPELYECRLFRKNYCGNDAWEYFDSPLWKTKKLKDIKGTDD
jgi:hypothetical protein